VQIFKKIIFPILGPAKGRKKVNINSILLLNIPACYQKKTEITLDDTHG
jgi:hypothetical protein